MALSESEKEQLKLLQSQDKKGLLADIPADPKSAFKQADGPDENAAPFANENFTESQTTVTTGGSGYENSSMKEVADDIATMVRNIERMVTEIAETVKGN